MSYRYGLNGNDIDWSEMEFLNSFIEELELAIFEGEAELDEDGYVTDEYYEGVSDSNPTYIYYKGDIDVQSILIDGKKIDDYLDWYIIHDTNDNFVTFIGDVPDKYLTEEYIAERNEAEEGIES
jgi:hypothetical protein